MVQESRTSQCQVGDSPARANALRLWREAFSIQNSEFKIRNGAKTWRIKKTKEAGSVSRGAALDSSGSAQHNNATEQQILPVGLALSCSPARR
jgi:hypothetical protein